MAQYLPLYRPGEVVSFGVTAAVTAGQIVEVGAADWAVAPAAAGSLKGVGVAGHNAAVGDRLAVEVGKRIDELKASGAVARGARVEIGAAGTVRTLSTGAVYGIALASAADGALVPVLAL